MENGTDGTRQKNGRSKAVKRTVRYKPFGNNSVERPWKYGCSEHGTALKLISRHGGEEKRRNYHQTKYISISDFF